MSVMPRAALACLIIVSASALASEVDTEERRDAPDAKPAWEFAVTAYPTAIRGGERYTSAVATADRGALHLEARYNYESIGARSAFVGWTFAGSETVIWEFTPLVGGAWGDTKAFVPGFEASVAWRRFDFYIEAEYVRDSAERADSYV